MYIEHHISTNNKEFRKIVDEKKLQYKENAGFVQVVIKESDPMWGYISDFVKRHNLFSMTKAVYSTKEMNQAEWFVVRCRGFWEYPMPSLDGSFKPLVYNMEKYCEKCGTGLVQKDLFRVKKEPNWGSKNFLMLNWIEDELFVSETAKNVLCKSSLKGFEVTPVLKYKKETQLENMFQLKISNNLSAGYIPDEEYVTEKVVCECCGTTKWVISGRGIAFDKRIFNKDLDIVKSNEGFGFGATAPKMILVSKKFYRLIKDNKLGKNLEFVPVELR